MAVIDHVFWAMWGVMGLLIVTSVIVFLLQKLKSDTDYAKIQQRMKSWWLLIGLLFVVLLMSNAAAIVFIGFLSYLVLFGVKRIFDHCHPSPFVA